MNEILEHLTPETIERMYKDIDASRIDLLRSTNDSNVDRNTPEYSRMGKVLEQIEEYYKVLTGETLWVKVIAERQF